MNRIIYFLILQIACLHTFGQNQKYWKNRKPHADYWQQDVQYVIDAVVDEKYDAIFGKMLLKYTNNSPDSLPFVYFHLYQNATQPGSYYDNLHLNNKIKPRYGPYESNKYGTVIQNAAFNGLPIRYELDNTIMKVLLPRSIAPGETVDFSMNFITFFDAYGSIRRRMKTFNAYGNKHYDGVHWYPRIDVYDRKFGWTPDQDLGREYYGDFGSFDVKLNFNASFIVEATGVLQNEKEVYPNDLKQKLQITNFKNKPLFEAPSIIIPYDSAARKIWHFRAENVHDFAFTADPTYRISELFTGNTKVVALVQEPHAALWQNTANFTKEVIEVYSRDFGKYEYPKIVVADARDGMEYPMITLNGGFDPGNRDLIAHEVGHNWYFGMVGTNETYRAFMDEGFTQFLTSWALLKIDGKYREMPQENNQLKAFFRDSVNSIESEVFMGYMRDAIRLKDPAINQYSDAFNGGIRHAQGYGQVYYKGATMLWHLYYVLGDSLFLSAMKHYTEKWKFAHPYPEDFRKSIIEYTKIDLNWFFDQWLEQTKHLDYKINAVKRIAKTDTAYTYQIQLKRLGRMESPLNVSVIEKNAIKKQYFIPNRPSFLSKKGFVSLPKWEGWDLLHPDYSFTIQTTSPIESIDLDIDRILPDIYYPDNQYPNKPEIRFDSKIYNPPNRWQYRHKWRPNVWFNDYDGLKMGIHTEGSYMDYKNQYVFDLMFNSRILQSESIRSNQRKFNDLLHVNFQYKDGIDRVIKNGETQFALATIDGLWSGSGALEQKFRDNKLTLRTSINFLYRNDSTDLNYLLQPSEWRPEKINSFLQIQLIYRVKNFYSNTRFELTVRGNAPLSDYDFSYLRLLMQHYQSLGKFEWRQRFFGQIASGSNVPHESALFLATGNPEEMMQNPLTRASGIIPRSSMAYRNNVNTFQFAGGLNIRGYAGYLVPELVNNQLIYRYRGIHGVSSNSELSLKKWIRYKWTQVFSIDPYLFHDMGIIGDGNIKNNINFSNLKMSSGAGFLFSVNKYPLFDTLKAFQLRLDFPLFLNSTPFVSPENVRFRYVLGINAIF